MELSLVGQTSGSYAPGTIPIQPPQSHQTARNTGALVLAGALAGLAGLALWRMAERRRQQPAEAHRSAARQLSTAASILSFSVLADSGIEHYRGAFNNPGMYAAPLTSSVMLVNGLHSALRPERLGLAGKSLCALSTAIGFAGFGFHLYNLTKREGGIDWLNLFYGAPIGAPFALALAGLAGLAASRLVAERGPRAMLFGRPAGQVIAAGSTVALIGTAGEAALMHFRGAWHDPFMFVPVTLPVASAAMLAVCVLRERTVAPVRLLLNATVVMGVAGVGFHLYGISRNMGGFYNISQNLLNGPPLPAPPSFTGVALAALAGLSLMEPA